MERTAWLCGAFLLFGATVVGCSRREQVGGATNTAAPSNSVPRNAIEVPAPWHGKPTSEWPQLVLTNEASFQDHSGLTGASAFLVENSKGVVVAATALHLLGEAGGVQPPLPIDEVQRALGRWLMFPRTQPEQSVEIKGVAVSGLDARDRDWAILSVKSSSPLPATPLRLRRRPVAVGESVYLIGCPYAEAKCRQNVYAGKVTARFRRDYWRFDIDPPVEIPGFSGAPIVDQHGLVVGVTTIAFEPRMRGSLWLESGGEDVGAVFDSVEAVR